MAAWVCADCTTVYSVDAPSCPHCRSTTHTEEGEMPKITEHGGPTVHVGGVAISATWGDSPDPETAGAVEPPASTAPAPDNGGAPSPGTSSATSPEKPQTSGESNSSAPPSPARKTASRSKQAPTADSSAPGMAGDPTDATSKP